MGHVRHLRPAKAPIHYFQRCNILNQSFPEIDAGATRENDHAGLGRLCSVGIFQSADRSFPEPRLAHRPEDAASYGTGEEKDDDHYTKCFVHADT